MALLALFVALGGTSYAAVKLPANSVGSAQIKNGAIRKADMNKRTVAALHGRRGPPGAPGQQGAQGIQGVKGDKGDLGPTYGAVSRLGAHSDPPVGGTLLFSKSVTLNAAGAMYVFGSIDTTVGCNSSGTCLVWYGLYVDNAPVPGSGRFISAPASQSAGDVLSLFGVIDGVSAGAHTLKLGYVLGANVSSVAWNDREVGGILLGGTA